MPPFSLAALLSENHLVLNLASSGAGEAVWEIVQRLRESGGLSQAEKFYELVMAREAKSSTVANGGVAFPHARTDLVEEIVLGIGRSREGVRFPGRAEPVHLLFVIGVPQQMVNDYLICVGALARLLKNDRLRQALIDAETPAEFLEELRRDG